MSKLFTALVVMVGLSIGTTPAIAANPSDYPIANGHFYTEANGTHAGPAGGGFSITNERGVPFWTFFSEHGGVSELGYPVSRRFMWDGQICQATQRAILQWDPQTNEVQLANLFDYLSRMGKDDWLLAAHLAPKPQTTPYETKPLSFLMLAHYRFAWLYNDPAIFHRYFSTPDYYTIYGLPTSPPEDLGPYTAMRFQRVVMYHWKFNVPWADNRGVSVGLAGDLFKELGFVPKDAIQPEKAPTEAAKPEELPIATSPPVNQTVMAASPISSITPHQSIAQPSEARVSPSARSGRPSEVRAGVATWYGASFHGQIMSDGRPYDMYDPSTTAANLYPLGTWLRVTRTTTGQSIEVQVTDHGAFRYPDIVDLSYAAFQKLADPAVGVISVQVEPVN